MTTQTITIDLDSVILTGADMLDCPVLDYQTGEDTGRVATAEDVARQVRAGPDVDLDLPMTALSGGQAARAGLAALILSR